MIVLSFSFLDNKGLAQTFILDIGKAFDTPPYDLLQSKSLSYVMCGTTLTWIYSFLCFRQQRVVVNGVKSDWALVSPSVSQGIIRGLLLFRIAQLVRCLTADMCLIADTCLTADPGVTSSITARSHTFLEIDHEIISMVFFLPFTDVASYKRMYVHEVLINRLVKIAQEKVWLGELKYDAADKETDTENSCSYVYRVFWPSSRVSKQNQYETVNDPTTGQEHPIYRTMRTE